MFVNWSNIAVIVMTRTRLQTKQGCRWHGDMNGCHDCSIWLSGNELRTKTPKQLYLMESYFCLQGEWHSHTRYTNVHSVLRVIPSISFSRTTIGLSKGYVSVIEKLYLLLYLSTAIKSMFVFYLYSVIVSQWVQVA